MFAGIVENKAKIVSIKDGRFTVSHNFSELQIGQSIAHDGACMTLETVANDYYTFFAMEESLKKTNFGDKKVGDFFNVERSLRVGDRIDGHFVSGHIDCRGDLSRADQCNDGSHILYFTFPNNFSKYVIKKGSICINGVSLTVVEHGENFLSVSIIPHTWKETNLGNLDIGTIVNLEFDMLGKYILNTQK